MWKSVAGGWTLVRKWWFFIIDGKDVVLRLRTAIAPTKGVVVVVRGHFFFAAFGVIFRLNVLATTFGVRAPMGDASQFNVVVTLENACASEVTVVVRIVQFATLANCRDVIATSGRVRSVSRRQAIVSVVKTFFAFGSAQTAVAFLYRVRMSNVSVVGLAAVAPKFPCAFASVMEHDHCHVRKERFFSTRRPWCQTGAAHTGQIRARVVTFRTHPGGWMR